MTLAKITVSGKITKNPEKRFTQNNLAITSFVIDVNPQDETLVRVFAMGNLADRTADTIKMGDTVLVDGRMQTTSVKGTNGKDRKIIEINAEKKKKITFDYSASVGGYSAVQSQPAQTTAAPKSSDIVQFAVDEISEDLIDEDEIPF